MVYLKWFSLVSSEVESNIVAYEEKRNIYRTQYPLGIFSAKNFKDIEFDPITIFYGGNGSGKSTLLNIIAEKIKANRKNVFSKGSFFNKYVSHCTYSLNDDDLDEINFIASDDVFDYLLNIRAINGSVDRCKDKLSNEYLNIKYTSIDHSLQNYELLKKQVDSRRKTMSKYVRESISNNTFDENSNGETSLLFFEKEINENSIYILDEPENSLSAENQLKLKKYIYESARFFNCQFIISTHSPFLLSLESAKIYDLDEVPVDVKKWTDLDNVRTYYNFFKENENQF